MEQKGRKQQIALKGFDAVALCQKIRNVNDDGNFEKFRWLNQKGADTKPAAATVSLDA